jgi:serine phosphatase RsbU (regulator of sigma subunit)
MRHFEPDAIASVLCAVITPALGQARLSCAGHLPPLIVRPGQPAELAEVAADVLIGVASPAPRRVSTIDLPPGAALCLYTDGLVERRDRPIDEGMARLATAVVAEDPEDACAAVMLAMSGYVTHKDDIALLMVRQNPVAARAGRPDSGQVKEVL